RRNSNQITIVRLQLLRTIVNDNDLLKPVAEPTHLAQVLGRTVLTRITIEFAGAPVSGPQEFELHIAEDLTRYPGRIIRRCGSPNRQLESLAARLHQLIDIRSLVDAIR